MHEIVTLIAKYFIVLPVLIAFVVWLKLKKQQKIDFVILGFCAAIIALGLAKLGSSLFHNPRPFVVGHFTPYFSHGSDNGFPSDHTLFGTLVAYVTLVYSRRLGYVALALALLVGAARVVAGVHHVIDIVGAAVISGVSVLLVYWIQTKVAKPKPVHSIRTAHKD